MRVVIATGAFALLLVAAPFIGHADDTDTQGWFQITFNRRDSKNWRYFGELQQRIGDDFNRPTIFLGRAAIGRQLSKDFSLWIGYAWTPAQLPRWRSEDRYFLQTQWETKSGSWNLINRTRLELRNIDDTGGSTYRLRHFLRGTTPFRTGSASFIALQAEAFYNVFRDGGRGPNAGYDQTRVFAGIGRNLTKDFRIEAGYQPVWLRLPGARRLDTLLVSANYNF